jgi:hypothetical protein
MATGFYSPGGTLISSFQWDESSFSASGVGCNSDLDIYLLDINGNVVAGGASDILAAIPSKFLDMLIITEPYFFL